MKKRKVTKTKKASPWGRTPAQRRRLARQYEEVSLSALRPWEDNPRFNAEAVPKVAALIKEHGFAGVITATPDGTIWAGNTRYKALLQLREEGWKGAEKVWVHWKNFPSRQAAEAFALSDNKSGEWADWDSAKLAKMFKARDRVDVAELEKMTGFTHQEIDGIVGAKDGLTDPDNVPKLAKAVSRVGDLWELGGHRLMCGDATEHADADKLMGGEAADVCITDPPYGIGLGYASFDDTKNAIAKLAADWLPLARKISKVVAFTSGITRQWVYPEPSWVMCWFYGGGQFCSHWGFSCWQPILCYGKDPSLAAGKGRRPDAVNLNTPANSKDIDHPCPKPVPIWRWLIERLSMKSGQIIYDPFCGAGTTIIAAEQLDRRCYALEIEPRYVDVSVRRWQEFTGHQATLENDDRTFAEVQAARHKKKKAKRRVAKRRKARA